MLNGYINNLNDSQKIILNEFKDILSNQESIDSIKKGIYHKYQEKIQFPLSIWNVNLEENSTSRDIILLKFLRAREFKLQESKDMLFKTLEWREEFNVSAVMQMDFTEKFSKLTEHDFKTDKIGRPIIVNYYEHLKITTEEEVQEFLRFKVQQMEKALDYLSKNDWSPAEDVIVIHDYNNISMFDRKSSKMVSSATINLFANNFPETLGIKVFINISWLLEKVFSFFLTFTPERTKSKFLVASGSTYREKLLKYIDADSLPKKLGGIPIDSQDDPVILTLRGKEIKSIKLPNTIESGDSMEWGYTCESSDIQFTIANESNNNILYKDQKDNSTSSLKFTNNSISQYQLIFDNSHSNQFKTIHYKFKIIKPSINNNNNNNNTIITI